MNFVYTIAAYTENKLPQYTLNNNLFIGEIGANSSGVFVKSAPTVQPDDLLPIENYLIDFVSINKSMSAGLAELIAIYNLYWRAGQINLPEYYIYYTQPTSNPIDFGRDGEGRKIQQISVMFITRLKNLIS